MLPIALHSGLALFFSATVFPSSVSSFYISKCHGVLLPLRSALQEQRKLLQTSTKSPEFTHAKATALIAASEAGLVPVASALYLLKRDVVWCRFSPADFAKLHDYARRMVVRVSGMASYFGVIDPTRDRFPATPAPTIPGSPDSGNPGPSQSPSVVQEDTETDVTESIHIPFEQTPTTDSSLTHAPSESTLDSPLQPGSILNARRRNTRNRHPRFAGPKTSSIHREHIHPRSHHRHKHIPSHGPLLPLILDGANSSQPAVGLYEAIRYEGLEKKFTNPAAICNTERFHRLLRECCDDMLEVADETLVIMDAWLNVVTNKSRFKFWRKKAECEKIKKERLEGLVEVKEKLDRVLKTFEKEKRCVGCRILLHGGLIVS